MPHTTDDAILRTSGTSWHWLRLPKPETQIRLLHFRPGSDEDEISADVEIFDLDVAPAFNAISYTWGTEPPESVIKIDDVSVSVRPNCHYALWQARLHFPGSCIWLDAICIDQSDLTEKATQVAMMGDIYAKATNVLACVGPADESSDGIRNALANLDAFVQRLPEEWLDSKDPALWRPPQDEATTVRLLEQFNEFGNRPYFTRVWIIQELFCGRGRTVVLCGSYQLDWVTLQDLRFRLLVVFFIGFQPYPGQFEFNGLYRVNALLTLKERSEFALPDLLNEIGHFHCDDSRDRIFGTVKLVDWARFGKTAPVPNYQMSPTELALDIMSLVDTQDMMIPRQLVRVLMVEDKTQSFENWLRTRSGRAEGPKVLPAPSPVKKFTTYILGAHIIRRDGEGRLSVALKAQNSATQCTPNVPDKLLATSNNSKALDSNFAERGFVPIFTDDDVSVLACREAVAEDIILCGDLSSLVLRAQDDGLSFIIVGQAMVVNDYGSRQDWSQNCICWQDCNTNRYKEEVVEVALDMSDEDALVAMGSRMAVEHGVCDMLTHLKHHSLGELKRGAVLTDVTMSNFGEDRVIGPPQALCARHQGAERYRTQRQALWYNIALDNGGWIYVSK